MAQYELINGRSGETNGPGFLGYLMIALWFLLTIMTSTTARAETAGATLTASDFLPDIESALIAQGAPAGAEIILADPDRAIAASGPLEIGHVSYSPASGRFVVRLNHPSAAIAGFIQTTESAPVLIRALARGDIIRDADIVYIESADMGGGRFVRDAADLIGKEARRPLHARTPLRSSDLAAPVLVKKGALVTLSYSLEGLRLTHQGVAMASGAAGELISVRNIQSERVLKGVVEAENFVTIAAPRTPLHSIEG